MGPPGSPSEVSEQDVRLVFAQSDPPYTPLTSTEVADALDCSPRTARMTLKALADRGALASKRVAESTRIWWPVDLDGADTPAARGLLKHDQFSAFIDAVTDCAIFLLDPDGNVVSWNQGAERIKGYADSEVIGRHLSTFYTPDDVDDGVPGRNLEAAAEAGSVEAEGWRVRKDGSRFWADVIITAIRDDDGELQGYTKVTQDTTERREYECQLEEQSERLERQRADLERELDDVFDRVDDAFYALDDAFRFSYVNERAEAYLGRSAGDLLGQDVREVLDVDEADSVIEAFETAMASQEPASFERYSDTLGLWATVRVYPSDTGLSVYFRDIDERKRAERKLRESEERFRTLMEHAPISMQLFDGEGRTIAANPAWERLWAASRDELVDYNILEDEQLEAAGILSNIREAFAGEVVTLPPVHYDPAEIGKPGRDRWIEGYAYPLLPSDGETFEVALVHMDITTRKERELELERYENAVETVWDGITVLDADERFVLVNEGFCELSGYDREELIGEHATLILDAATYERAGELHQEVDKGVRDIATLEYDLHTADGGTVPVEARFGPVEYADGTAGGAGVVRDITERRERERELERVRSRMEFALQSTDTIVWDWNVDADEASFYPSEESLYGTTVEDWEDFLEVVHPADRQAVQAGIEMALETGEPKYEEIRIVRDGEVRWVEAPGQPIRGGDDEPTRMIGVVRDVTARKERERALERYETLIQESADVNAILDPDGTLQYVTPSVAHVLGYDAEEVLGMDVFEHLHPDDREETRALFTALLDGDGKPPKAEFRFRAADGSWVWLESHGRNLLDDPDIDGIVVYTRDVTDRKRYEERLSEAVDQLAASNERLEQFAYVASHDLREPLRMVSSYLQLVEDRYGDALDEDGREFIAFAVDGAERMREMIDGLLAYSRIDTQAEPLEPTDCEAVVERVRWNLQVQIEETGAEVDVEPLPTVPADESQLEQVFQNLVSNAIKYRGDEPPRIEISADREADAWLFRVADNGIGMAPEDADRVFEVFKRLHTTDEYPGTGIGLALCKKIVERHGGDIRVESEPNEGSTFLFTIPFSPDQQPA